MSPALRLLTRSRSGLALVGVFQVRRNDEGIAVLAGRFPERAEVRHIVSADFAFALLDFVFGLRPMGGFFTFGPAGLFPKPIGAFPDAVFAIVSLPQSQPRPRKERIATTMTTRPTR